MHCIDHFVSAGKWSPVLLYVPMSFFLAIAADVNAAMMTITMLMLILFFQWAMNSPDLYRWSRPAHFPLRLVLIYIIIQRMGASSDAQANRSEDEGGGNPTSILGFIVALLFCFLEMILGDGGAILAYRLHCSYEVIRPLPNRIFICRRHGAAHSQDIGEKFIHVSEKITGMGSWQEDFAIIADVKGLLLELKPMSKDDWKRIFVESQLPEDETNGPVIHRFIGLDVYSPGAATVDALNAAIDEQAMLLAKNAKRAEWKKGQDKVFLTDV